MIPSRDSPESSSKAHIADEPRQLHDTRALDRAQVQLYAAVNKRDMDQPFLNGGNISLACQPAVAILALFGGAAMRTMSARDAKNSFGLLLDYARAEPVRVEKHGRAVVVVVSVEEFERLKRSASGASLLPAHQAL